MMNEELNVDLIFVTGMSGAGRSTTLKILEDIGYNIVDALPPFLFPAFLKYWLNAIMFRDIVIP